MIPVISLDCPSYDLKALKSTLQELFSALGGIENIIKPAQKVLIKPNLLRASLPEKCVTTHPFLVRALTEMLKDIGAQVIIGDSPSLGPFQLVAKRTGMLEVAKSCGVEIINLDQTVSVNTPSGFSFKKLELDPRVLEVDHVINLPKLKTHSMTLLSLGVKNLFGCVPGTKKSSWHLKAGIDRESFSTLLLEIALTVKPSLTILDAIWGMEGNGPSSGDRRFIGKLVASKDPLALDRAILEGLGLPLEALLSLKVAQKRGILPEVKVLGDPLKLKNFKLPKGTIPLPSPFKFLRRFFIPKPKLDVQKCEGCGECAQVCPPGAIKLKDKRPVFDLERCICCYCCQEICVRGAIKL